MYKLTASDTGKFIVRFEARDARGEQILGMIEEFQQGTSCRLDLEADILESLMYDARLAANRARQEEQAGKSVASE